MGALNVGQPLVIMARFDPEETLRLIEAHRVTTAYMVPTQFHRLLRLPGEQGVATTPPACETSCIRRHHAPVT